MKVYFLRHGIAVEPEAWSGGDFDRPLSREGCERVEREAKAIEALCLDLDCILTSPLVRARQTAKIVGERLGECRLIEDTRLAGDFDVDHLTAILSAYSDANAIMLVGHEPSMSTTIGRAIGNARIEMKKAALAGVEFPHAGAVKGALICLIPPKILVALARRNRS